MGRNAVEKQGKNWLQGHHLPEGDKATRRESQPIPTEPGCRSHAFCRRRKTVRQLYTRDTLGQHQHGFASDVREAQDRREQRRDDSCTRAAPW